MGQADKNKDPHTVLNNMMKELSDVAIPEVKQMMADAKAKLRESKPLAMKKFEQDGISCMAHLYEDKVTLTFPALDMTKKYYDSL